MTARPSASPRPWGLQPARQKYGPTVSDRRPQTRSAGGRASGRQAADGGGRRPRSRLPSVARGRMGSAGLAGR